MGIFDSLVSEDAKGNSTTNNGGRQFERVSVTSDHSMIDEVDTGGSALVGEDGQLSQEPQTVEQKDGTEIVELGKFENDEALDTSEMPSEIPIDSSTMARSALFTEAEKNTLEELEAEERLSDSDKESLEKISEALDDESMPNTRQGLLTEAARKEGKFGLGGEEFDDKQDKIRAELSDRDWIEESPEEKQVSEMTGEEFAEILKKNTGGSEEAELAEREDPTGERLETGESLSVPDIEESIAEQAASEWSQRGGVWEEFAEDMQTYTQIPNCHVTSIASDRKRIVTSHNELKSEIYELEDADILEKDGDVIVAEVPAREEF